MVIYDYSSGNDKVCLRTEFSNPKTTEIGPVAQIENPENGIFFKNVRKNSGKNHLLTKYL